MMAGAMKEESYIDLKETTNLIKSDFFKQIMTPVMKQIFLPKNFVAFIDIKAMKLSTEYNEFLVHPCFLSVSSSFQPCERKLMRWDTLILFYIKQKASCD